MHPTPNTITAFACLELSPAINRQLDKLGFVTPTPIQAAAIPHLLAGKDVIGIAQTGTGKTFAFGLPILQRLLETEEVALILAPTRELALQIEEELKKVGSSLGLRTAVLIGGAPMNRQVQDLRRRPNVIVATPGRLKDHLYQRTTNLKRVSVVVLDEADRMLDMGFAPAVKQILDQAPIKRQTMLFSATMAKEVTELASQYLTNPVRVEVAPQGTPADLVDHSVHVVEKERKPDLLSSVLYENKGTVLVFSRTRHGARKVARNVRDLGITAAELHSDRTLPQRKAALAGFKSGEFRVLVATDIAARGIDVKEIELVVNYDLPDCIEDYVHRIGRTGRAGASGRAVTFALPDQHRDVREIERLIGKELSLISGSLPAVVARQSKSVKPGANHRPHKPAQSRQPERTERSEPSVEAPTHRVYPPREQRPFSPKKPRALRPAAAPVEPSNAAPHQRPRPDGTPKKFQKSDSKPRWKTAEPPKDYRGSQQNGKPRQSDSTSPQAHRPGIGGNQGNRTDRPAFGGNRGGPKNFGRPQGGYGAPKRPGKPRR
jgi:ATP-dependent RNA helicase RhlE